MFPWVSFEVTNGIKDLFGVSVGEKLQPSFTNCFNYFLKKIVVVATFLTTPKQYLKEITIVYK